MGTNRSLFLILIAVCLAACGDKERQQQLESREQAIIKREMEFAAKAADYQSLLRLRDSILSKKSDTVLYSSGRKASPAAGTEKCYAGNPIAAIML